MKNYSITIYLKNGEKAHSHNMDKAEAKAQVAKLKAKKQVYMVWDFEANDDVTYNFK